MHIYVYLFILNFQDDGGKKIELKPGFLMEHDKDVYFYLVLYECISDLSFSNSLYKTKKNYIQSCLWFLHSLVLKTISFSMIQISAITMEFPHCFLGWGCCGWV